MFRPLELSNPPTSNLVLSEYKYLVWVLEEAKHRRDAPDAQNQGGGFIPTLKNFIHDCAQLVCTSPCRHNQNMQGIINQNPQTHPQVLLDKYKNIIKFTGVDFETTGQAQSNKKFNESEYYANLKKLIELYERKELLQRNNNLSNEFLQTISNLELVIEKQLEMKSKATPTKSTSKPAPTKSTKPAPTKTTTKPAPTRSKTAATKPSS